MTKTMVSRQLADIDQAQWDSLLGARGFYSASPWLRHAEATATPAPFYFTAYLEREMVAALPAYPLDTGTPYVFCRADRVVDRIQQQIGGGDTEWAHRLMPSLLCGGRNPSHAKAGISRMLDRGHQRRLLSVLVTAAEKQARAEHMNSMSFLCVDEDDSALREALDGLGYVALPNSTAYSLAVPLDRSFDSYLARFGHRRRGKINRELRTLAEAEVRYHTQPLASELADRIAPLELALYARHGTPAAERAFAQVLHSIAANTGGTARVTTAYIDDELAGFVLFFTYREEIYARQTGFDYGRKGSVPLYFGLVYYELLRIALAENVRHIHYSTGSGQAKTLRGCTPCQQIAYLKAFSPDLQDKLHALAQARSDLAARTVGEPSAALSPG